MKTVIVSWLGNTDLNDWRKKAAAGPDQDIEAVMPGPVERVALEYAEQLMLENSQLAELHILASWGNVERNGERVTREKQQKEVEGYCQWLQKKTPIPVKYSLSQLKNVTDFGEIFTTVSADLNTLIQGYQESPFRLVFHISSGTPAMQAIWLLLAKTEYPGAELIKTSVEAGLESVDFPFDIAVRHQSYFPLVSGREGMRIQGLDQKALCAITWRSPQMQEALQLTANVALHDRMHVLIEGEGGVGKELFAGLIHQSSRRKNGPFVIVNCGALPGSLIESELFGHKKGAFTGADRERIGKFQQANAGILFLDEIGDLPLEQQVKILRLTDTHQQVIVPVGARGEEDEIPVSVRIVAATNRNLLARVADGTFREDLFFRLAVGHIRVPSLRERKGDLDLLIDHFVKKLNEQAPEDRFRNKCLSSQARLCLHSRSWPGNIRELEHTLTKALWLYGDGPVVNERDVQRAMLTPADRSEETGLLNRPLGPDLQLEKIATEVKCYYILRAMREAGSNNLAAIARLLGMQPGTLRNQLHRESSPLRAFLMTHPEGCRLFW